MIQVCPLSMADQVKQCNHACRFFQNGSCLLVTAVELYVKDKTQAHSQPSPLPQTEKQDC